MKILLLQIANVDLNYKLQLFYLHPSMFSFGLSSVIFMVFVADFEHVFVCICKIIVFLVLKNLVQQTNTYSKSVTKTLKQDVKSIKSEQ